MHRAFVHDHRRWGPIALGLLVLVAVGVAVDWNRSKLPSTMRGRLGAPPVITIEWRTVGHGVEPWSGVGLAEQVRQALSAHGVAVSQNGRSPGLDPTYLLAGTVGRRGDRNEIGMQLVRVQDGATVWASTFWRDPTDLQSLVSDLAATVAQVLETEVSPDRRAAR
jgi:hypothetical protein